MSSQGERKKFKVTIKREHFEPPEEDKEEVKRSLEESDQFGENQDGSEHQVRVREACGRQRKEAMKRQLVTAKSSTIKSLSID